MSDLCRNWEEISLGIFDEKIKQQARLDDEMFVDAFQKMAGVVTGQTGWERFESDRLSVLNAIEEVGNYLQITIPYSSYPDLTVDWYLEEYLRPQGIMWRNVELKENWYENAAGVMLGVLENGKAVALIPGYSGNYTYRDPETGKKLKITGKTAGAVQKDAILFYRPLPLKPINMKDIWKFIMDSVPLRDVFSLILAGIVVILLGLATPHMTRILFSYVADTRDLYLLRVIILVLLLVTAAAFIVTCIRQLLISRITGRVLFPLQAAFMMRMLTAPTGELKYFSAGDLGSRIGSMRADLNNLLSMYLSRVLSALLSLVSLIPMFFYAPLPAVVALIVAAVLVVLYVHVIRKQANISAERMAAQAEESGLTYRLIGGIQKITLSGSEKRAFAVWARVYRKSIQLLYNPPRLLKIYSTLTAPILLAGTIVMYDLAAVTGVSEADFYAFLSSYGLLTAALTAISGDLNKFSKSVPVFRNLKPLMDFNPELQETKEVVHNLRGNIALRNVTFRYTDHSRPVLENLNMEVRQGEYVALVGKSGCGKSTIVRLLLGFEVPDHGDILYDNKNLQSLDLTSLRRKIGTVMQKGDIFRGTIFSNITITSPDLTVEEAWKAAEIAGIADDIRRMPLQMNTPLPDGGKGVSGGQKQRLTIARAIASKPSILIFDEATSALDNLTQKAVSDALGEMHCTRIVIAHRLSTICNCDRILCMDGGRIAEEGTYEQLIARNGLFAELVQRQLL